MAESRALAAQWQVWIAESLISGDPVHDIVATLVSEGLNPAQAREQVLAIQIQPGTIAARALVGPAAKVTQLRRATRSVGRGRVERRAGVDATTLRDVYAAHGVPVVLADWCAHWPASAWTPELLAARVGDEVVTVSEGSAPDRDRHWRQHARQARFADVVADVLANPDDGLRYLIAQHRNLDGPLAALLADLTPDPDVIRVPNLKGNASLWFGPANTVTPAHHDASGILICVLYGSKRFWLAAPDEVRLAGEGRGFYASHPLSTPGITEVGGALEGGRVYEVVVQAGDALYIPPCWWHEVRAQSVCIHVSMVGMQWPNRFEDYRQGS